MKTNTNKFITLISLLIVTMLLASCAHNRNPSNPADPLEPLNRKVFAFNRGVDKILLRPLAVTYTTITPRPLQTGIYNALNNVGEITNVANDLLQGNIKQTLADTWRFIINTTVGIGGLFDVAKHVGLKRNNNSFGLTLAKWGVRKSPYIVVPFFGPSTPRDSLGFVADFYMSPWAYINPKSLRYGLHGFRIVETRSRFLDTDVLVNQAFDPYIFVRDAYLQSRQYQIEQMLNQQPAESGYYDQPQKARKQNAKQGGGEPLVAKPLASNAEQQPLVAQPLVAEAR